jgi:signal transduction histidine kinase
MVQERPWLGIGPGNTAFNLIYPLYQQPKFNALSAYSVPLELLVEGGIPALLAGLGLLAASLRQGLAQLRGESAVMADPTQIHQVIVNLCTNAGHAMLEKGGELFIGLEDLQPAAAFFAANPDLRPGAYQKLTVRDSGHGIPADMLTSIFEPFVTTKQRGEGTGMGLAVVKGIVNRHRDVDLLR